MLHFADRKEKLRLNISDFDRVKGIGAVIIRVMLKNIYDNTPLYFALDGLSKLIGGFLDMISWQTRFRIIQELLFNTEVSFEFAT